MCICGTVLIVVGLASLTNDSNLSQSISIHTTIQYHWGEFFLYDNANRMYTQLEIKLNGNLQGRFFILYQYTTLHVPLTLLSANNVLH